MKMHGATVELVDNKLNNKILLCLTGKNKFLIVFQFCNTTGCPLQKGKKPPLCL
jgi:peroxiredoxin